MNPNVRTRWCEGGASAVLQFVVEGSRFMVFL